MLDFPITLALVQQQGTTTHITTSFTYDSTRHLYTAPVVVDGTEKTICVLPTRLQQAIDNASGSRDIIPLFDPYFWATMAGPDGHSVFFDGDEDEEVPGKPEQGNIPISSMQLLPGVPLSAEIQARADLTVEEKRLYSYLLWLREEVCRPGRSALVIQLSGIGCEVYPPISFPADWVRERLDGLQQALIITYRPMQYPPDYPPSVEVSFLQLEEEGAIRRTRY